MEVTLRGCWEQHLRWDVWDRLARHDPVVFETLQSFVRHEVQWAVTFLSSRRPKRARLDHVVPYLQNPALQDLVAGLLTPQTNPDTGDF